MAPLSIALIWLSLLARYSAPAWPALAQLARTTYAQQRQLLRAAQSLAPSASTPTTTAGEALVCLV